MKKYLIFIITVTVFIGIIICGLYISKQYVSDNNEMVELNVSERMISNEENVIEEKESIVVELNNEKDIAISMSVIGDIMCHNSQYNDAFKNGVYDFSYVFEDIKHHIESADISIGNLETTFAGKGKGYSSYPTFNTPEVLAKDLKELGIDVVSTVNNHSLDMGYSGIESTIDYLDIAEVSHTGTYKSQEAQNEILFKEVNGLKIAFLAYTYGTNGIAIPKGREYCINLINKELMVNQLNLAKEGNPDIICVNMHWGVEYENLPNEEQLDLENFLFENGVDIILGSHPHVLQPMETKVFTMPDGTEKNVFVIYSLGNFMSGQNKTNTRNSIILKINIIREGNTGKLRFENIEYVPIYTYTSPKYRNYKILDLPNAILEYENGNPKNYTKEQYELFRNEFESVHSRIVFE